MNTEAHTSGEELISYRCPRCGRDIEESILLPHVKAEEYLIGLIRRDHPEWVLSNGECPRCKGYYRALVERTGV